MPIRLAMKPGVSLQRTTRLAELQVGEAVDGGDGVRARARPGGDLEQPQVARRVEEMRDQEVGGEAAGMVSTRVASGMVDVFDETMEPGRRTRSIFS